MGIAVAGGLLTAMEFIREAIGCATTQSLQDMSAAQGLPMCHFWGHCRYILLQGIIVGMNWITLWERCLPAMRALRSPVNRVQPHRGQAPLPHESHYQIQNQAAALTPAPFSPVETSCREIRDVSGSARPPANASSATAIR